MELKFVMPPVNTSLFQFIVREGLCKGDKLQYTINLTQLQAYKRCNSVINPSLRMAVLSVTTKVRIFCELGYVMPCEGKVTDEMPCASAVCFNFPLG
jgi:hypothetical protein